MAERVHITQHSATGMLWFIGWLFTIGYLNLGLVQILLGLFVWPYYLGAHFAGAGG